MHVEAEDIATLIILPIRETINARFSSTPFFGEALTCS